MCGLMALDLGRRSRASDLLLSMLYVFTSAFALFFFLGGRFAMHVRWEGVEWDEETDVEHY